MKLRIVDARAFSAGLFYLVVGVAAFIGSHQYDIGQPLNMGPGFFPLLIGVVLAVLGVVSIIQGIRAEVPVAIERRSYVPVLLVLVGVVSFALLIERAGLLVAIAALIFFSCFQRLLKHPIEVLLIYLALAAFSAGLFIYALDMPIQIGWWS